MDALERIERDFGHALHQQMVIKETIPPALWEPREIRSLAARRLLSFTPTPSTDSRKLRHGR
jgi:hypothetical protein